MSDPGDFIGQGATRRITSTDSRFSARYTTDGSGTYLQVQLQPADPAFYWLSWLLFFGVSTGQSLGIGAYESAERWQFQSPGHPGMAVNGNARSCNTVSGRFEIKELVLGGDGSVQRLLLTFEQHCDGSVPALRGEVSFGG